MPRPISPSPRTRGQGQGEGSAGWKVAAVLLLGLILTGCMPRVPKQALERRATIAVAYVVDPEHLGEPETAPDSLKTALRQELDTHNLEVVEVPLEAIKGERLTEGRMLALRSAKPDAAFYLLVQLRVQFFSQLDGRYRWEVGTSLTAARADGRVATDAFEAPVVLMYDHEQGPEAITAAAFDTANRLGTLMDGLMVGYSPGAAPKPHAARAPSKPNAVYFVMVDRFADGDRSNDGDSDERDPSAFHGGDLKGVLQHLDWLERLGVDTLWLSPVFTMRTAKWFGHGAFHGYWTWDLRSVEPRFGDLATLKLLSSELHRRGMKLVLDLVLNHVGPDAPLLATHPEWFHKKGGVTDWNDPEQLVTHDVHGLPDLAQEKPEVRAYLLDGARRWLRAG